MSQFTRTARRSGPRPAARRRSYSSNYPKKRQPAKAYIHPSRFIKEAKPVAAEVYVPTHQFADFAVHELLKSNAQKKGLHTPTPIQDQSIPHGLSGSDVIGIANTGTGKTIAFALPVLHKLITDPSSYALIVAPTRELAQQIEDEARAIGRGSGLHGALLIGGTPMPPQLRDLRSNPRIVIGTPGRIKDHIERGTLNISKFNIVVLDEVDRMLDMGFIHEMTTILQQLATPRQSFFYSATMDNKVRALIDGFTDSPVHVSVKTAETSDNVHQDVVAYQTSQDKVLQLHNLLNHERAEKVLVFDETQRSVEKLANELIVNGFRADAIHGGKSQGQRQRALNKFKKNEVKILVATDVAARGIDVADVTHVINYTEPQAYDDYVHRIGRAGRAGRIGYAYTFIKV